MTCIGHHCQPQFSQPAILIILCHAFSSDYSANSRHLMFGQVKVHPHNQTARLEQLHKDALHSIPLQHIHIHTTYEHLLPVH